MVYLYIALFCLVLFFLWRKRRHSLADFPGPRGLPIVGCYFGMRGKPMHDVLYDWSMKYGGAFKFSLFGKEYLVISRPDTLHEALVSRGKAYAGRRTFYSIETITRNLDLAFTNNLALNGTLRKAVHGSIKTYGAGRTKLTAILDTAVAELVERFAANTGNPFDPKEATRSAISLTIGLLFVGHGFDKEVGLHTFEELNERSDIISSRNLGTLLLDAVPFLRGLHWFPPCKHIKEYVEFRDKMFQHLILPPLVKAKGSKEQTVGLALLDIVGQKYGEGDEAGEINMTNVKLACQNLLRAGTITTSNTFYALLNVLQWNPDIQERIYQEVMREVGDDRAVLLEDKEKLPYSRAVVLEALRYVTVAPLGLPRVTRVDTSVSGIAVPQGTQVIMNLWTCHHDPRLWPDPWTFKPERFLDESGQLVLADHSNRKQMFPFGAGPRVCVGEVLALSRLFLFLTNCV